MIIRSGGRASRSWQQALAEALAIGMRKTRATAAIAPGLNVTWGNPDSCIERLGENAFLHLASLTAGADDRTHVWDPHWSLTAGAKVEFRKNIFIVFKK